MEDEPQGFITPNARQIPEPNAYPPRIQSDNPGAPSTVLLAVLTIMVAIHAYVLLMLVLVQKKSHELDARLSTIEQQLDPQ